MTVANDFDSAEKLSAFEQHLANPSSRNAFRFLIEAAATDPRYLLIPEGGVGSQKRSVKYLFGDVYAYAFIVNRKHLLFYFRKPSGRVNEDTLNSLRARGLKATFIGSPDQMRNEISFRIELPSEASAALEELLAEQGAMQPEADAVGDSDTTIIAASPVGEWSDEELLDTVASYRQIQDRERRGLPGQKREAYRALSEKFGRTSKAFEFRMQNISAVLAMLGRDWISGLKPAKHIGRHVATRIEQCIYSLDGVPETPHLEFDLEVQERLARLTDVCPEGRAVPQRAVSLKATFSRDASVKAWVLNRANGICESCAQPAPFVGSDGTPYLEVHHLRTLADGGSDMVSNAVALCPNCHRRLHYDPKAKELKARLFATVQELKQE